MKKLPRLFGFRVRDGIAFGLIWAVASCSCLSTFLFWRAINRYVVPCVVSTRDAVALASASSNFCSRVLSLSLSPSSLSESSASASTNNPVPVVLGYGQTKSPSARYIYRDIRLPSGEVQRDYIARYPLDK